MKLRILAIAASISVAIAMTALMIVAAVHFVGWISQLPSRDQHLLRVVCLPATGMLLALGAVLRYRRGRNDGADAAEAQDRSITLG